MWCVYLTGASRCVVEMLDIEYECDETARTRLYFGCLNVCQDIPHFSTTVGLDEPTPLFDVHNGYDLYNDHLCADRWIRKNRTTRITAEVILEWLYPPSHHFNIVT